VRNPRVDAREPASEEVHAALLLPPLRAAGVAADPPGAAAYRGGQPRLQTPDRPPEASPVVQQVAVATLPLVVAGAADRPCPSGSRCADQRTLSAEPRALTETEPAAFREITPAR